MKAQKKMYNIINFKHTCIQRSPLQLPRKKVETMLSIYMCLGRSFIVKNDACACVQKFSITMFSKLTLLLRLGEWCLKGRPAICRLVCLMQFINLGLFISTISFSLPRTISWFDPAITVILSCLENFSAKALRS